MKESLALFAEVVKNPLFKNTPIFVFLNKKDLFEEMIPKYPLKNCFPEYEGPPGEVMPALEFIKSKYLQIIQENLPGKPIYIQVIAARVRHARVCDENLDNVATGSDGHEGCFWRGERAIEETFSCQEEMK